MLANLEIGLHEQTRLQPEIREAMDAATTPDRRLWKRILGWPLQRQLTRLSRELITESFMVLTLPDRVLALGPQPRVRGLSAGRRGARRADRRATSRCRPRSTTAGPQDWSVLTQRMHYIVHLFRAYHEDATLASAPFTPAQVERIRAGELPDGEL